MLAGKAEDLGACVQSCAAVCPRPQASLDIQAGEYLDLPAPEGGHSSYPPTPGPWSVGRRESTLWPGPQRAAAGPGLVPLTFAPPTSTVQCVPTSKAPLVQKLLASLGRECSPFCAPFPPTPTTAIPAGEGSAPSVSVTLGTACA